MGNYRIALIHHSTSYDSMERFALMLQEAAAGIARLYSLVYRPIDSRPQGSEILVGIFQKNKIMSHINYFYPQITVSGYKKLVNSVHSKGGAIHYTAGYIYPYNLTENDIVTIHDIYHLLFPSKVPPIERIYNERSLKKFESARLKNIVVDSVSTKRTLEENGVDSNITVIYPPISNNFVPLFDKGIARKKLGLPLDKKIVLSVSNAQWRKNLKGIREAVDLLGSDFILVRVGPKVGNSITFTGIDDQTMNLLYNASDVLLYPSFYEGFGFVPLEASKTGLPVVVSEIEIFREVLGNYPVYVDPYNPKDISLGVRNALGTATNRPPQTFDRFSYQSFQDSLLKFYAKALNF